MAKMKDTWGAYKGQGGVFGAWEGKLGVRKRWEGKAPRLSWNRSCLLYGISLRFGCRTMTREGTGLSSTESKRACGGWKKARERM
jgi:hypothetical protein